MHGASSGDFTLRGFPQHILAPGDQLFRIHRSICEPWYFGNDGSFRFDLTASKDHGTCYMAEDPLGAFVETLQGFRSVPIPREELEERRLFQVTFEHALSLADLTTNVAGVFEIDASISAGSPDDYAASQKFANEAFEAGFAGIRFRVRHDLEQQMIGVALFGPLGVPTAPMPDGISEQIPQSVIHQACKQVGFMVRGPLLEPV